MAWALLPQVGMKSYRPSYKILFGIFLGLALTACGQFQTEKITPNVSLNGVNLPQMGDAEFQNYCSGKGGVIDRDTCKFVRNAYAPGSGTSATYSENTVAALVAGSIVQASGSGAVEIYVGNQRIGQIPLTARLSQTGDVRVRLSPGSYSNVQVLAIECHSRSGQPTGCP